MVYTVTASVGGAFFGTPIAQRVSAKGPVGNRNIGSVCLAKKIKKGIEVEILEIDGVKAVVK